MLNILVKALEYQEYIPGISKRSIFRELARFILSEYCKYYEILKIEEVAMQCPHCNLIFSIKDLNKNGYSDNHLCPFCKQIPYRYFELVREVNNGRIFNI